MVARSQTKILKSRRDGIFTKHEFQRSPICDRANYLHRRFKLSPIGVSGAGVRVGGERIAGQVLR